jgi:capsular exopolysaccharide synthesis family protein
MLPAPAPGPDYLPAGLPGIIDVQPSPFRLQRFLIFLRRHWWIPVVTFLLGTAASGLYVYLKPPTFVSQATMWETAKLRLPEGTLFSEDLQNYLGTQMELLKSAKLRQAALERLPTNSVPLDKDRKPLKVNIKITEAPKSSVFLVQASSADPVFSQVYLDALMNQYLAYKKNVRKTVSGDTLASISDQVSRAEKELQDTQEALVSYQRSNNLAVILEESTIAGGYLARLKTQLSDYELEQRLLQATSLDSTTNAAGLTNSTAEWLQTVTAATSSSSSSQPNDRQAAFRELELLKLQREKLSKNLRPKHPKIVKLDGDIDRSQKLLEIYRRQTRDQLEASRQALTLKIDNVLTSIKEWEGKVMIANSRVADAERLKQNVNRSQAVYERLVALLRNVDISRSIDQETLSVLEYASPALRSYIEEIRALGLGAGAGLALGIGCILLLAWRDDRFTSVAEVVEKLPDEIVGQVPEVRHLKEKGVLLLEGGEEQHMFLESYRNLRSALLFLAVEGTRPKVLLITSALPNEGKSTIAANLARTLAQGGAKVLLVDADLRRGALNDLLGLQRCPGLVEVLKAPASLDYIIQSNCQPNLSFIASGARTQNPGDLFLGTGLDQLLARWREQYDYVIIDSTPVFAADDAATLSAKVDGTLFVVRSRYSGARQVQEALALLYKRQARVLGLVFNRANAGASSYYYYKYPKYYAAKE